MVNDEKMKAGRITWKDLEALVEEVNYLFRNIRLEVKPLSPPPHGYVFINVYDGDRLLEQITGKIELRKLWEVFQWLKKWMSPVPVKVEEF